jgi:Tfp pilus assembly protein PilF
MDSEGRLACGAVFAAAMAAYLLTMCPTVYTRDTGDLITASYTLGVAHATGYPLYMLVGKLFSLIPYGDVAYRYNLMGGLFSAATAALACLVAGKLTKSWQAAAGAGLLVAYSWFVWDQGTVAEVYGIHAFFTTLLLWLALRWRDRHDEGTPYLFAAAYGLALTNHLSTLLYAPAYAYLMFEGRGRGRMKADFKKAAAAFLAPLTLYLYLPLRAMADPVYNWRDPSTLDRFIMHVTGTVHRSTVILTLPASAYLGRLGELLWQIVPQFSLVGIVPAWGLVSQWRRNGALLRFTALMAAADLFYGLFLNDVPVAAKSFSLPTIVLLGIWGGFGFAEAFRMMGAEGRDARARLAVVVAAALLVVAANYHTVDKSKNLIAFDYAMNILKSVDKGAVIFAEGDNTVFPLSYLLYVEGVRPDVSLYDRDGVLSHRLYGIDFFWLPQGERYARGLEVERSVLAGSRPVYYTSPVEASFPGYELRQAGLVYRMAPANESGDGRDYWRLYDMREVWNSTIYLDYTTRPLRAVYYIRLAQEVGKSEKARALGLLAEAEAIIPDNANVRYDAGAIRLSQGDYGGAIAELRAAVELDPGSARAHNILGYAYAMRGQKDSARTEYEAALAADPTYLKAKANLAVFLAGEGDLNGAAQQYRDILKADPGYAKAYFDLGFIYYKAGRKDAAAGLWERYLELSPKDPRAQEMRALIAEVKAAGNATAPANATAASGAAGLAEKLSTTTP